MEYKWAYVSLSEEPSRTMWNKQCISKLFNTCRLEYDKLTSHCSVCVWTVIYSSLLAVIAMGLASNTYCTGLCLHCQCKGWTGWLQQSLLRERGLGVICGDADQCCSGCSQSLFSKEHLKHYTCQCGLPTSCSLKDQVAFPSKEGLVAFHCETYSFVFKTRKAGQSMVTVLHAYRFVWSISNNAPPPIFFFLPREHPLIA